MVNPISPDSGWFVSSGIPVAFEATDDRSGVKATYYTIDDGATQTYGPVALGSDVTLSASTATFNKA